MVKKSLKFYLTTIICSLVYSYTIGGVIGWFVTEDDTPIAALIVSILSFIAMLVGTSFLIKDIFNDYEFEKFDVLKFLIPYLVILGIFIFLFIVNLSGFFSQFEYSIMKENSIGDVIFGLFRSTIRCVLTFLLPSAYSVLIIHNLFNFSFLAYFIPALIFSAIHILLIVIVLSSMKKRTKQS